MRNLFFWLVLLFLGGCAGNYYSASVPLASASGYPGRAPHCCRVSDGYCYYRYISHDQMLVDVYLWTPKDGWKLHHTEQEQ